MTTSAAPRLNRLVTVTASSTTTAVRHTPFAYQRLGQPDPDNSGWYWVGRGASRASDLVGIGSIMFATETYGRGGYTSRTGPNFGALLGAGATHLYLLTPDGDDSVKWPILDVSSSLSIPARGGPVRSDPFPRVPMLTLGDAVTVGDDFDLAPMMQQDYLYRFNVAEHPDLWGVETLETQTPAERVERRVWCRLTERDAGAGQIRISTPGTSRQPQRESCTIMVRYAVDLTIAQEVEDWRARVWDVDQSRTVMDERFIVYECSRAIDATPPDVMII